MDARSARVQERLNTSMLIAAALTIPTVAITKSHPGGAPRDVAVGLNWLPWLAFLVDLAVMLSVVPNRRLWLRRHRSVGAAPSSSPWRRARSSQLAGLRVLL